MSFPCSLARGALVANCTDTPSERSGSKRRVLMIAAAFPPTGGPGVQRSAKFAKYLPQFGWLPTVWTMDRMEGLPEDPTLLDDLPDEVRIQRWNRGKPARRFQKFFKRRAAGRGMLARIAKAIEWRLESKSLQDLWPDECVGWANASKRALIRLVEEEQIDLLYSTFSPASNHLLGLAMKQETGLPWVADFRDLWTKDPRYTERLSKWRADDARLEKKILETANVVIGVTKRQTAILAEPFPDQKDKFVTITNGFDPSDFEEAPEPGNADRDWFVMAHVGRLDKQRANESWFEGLQRFVTSLGGKRNSFLLRVIGHADKSTLEKLKQTGVRYAFTGYESHAQAIHEMRTADALLLLVSDQPGAESVIPAKLFEYLASQRPILLSGPHDGACVDIVRRCKAGLSVATEAQDIADAFGRMYRLWENAKPMVGCTPSDALPYSRVTLTQQLANVFDDLIRSESTTPTTAQTPVEVSV